MPLRRGRPPRQPGRAELSGCPRHFRLSEPRASRPGAVSDSHPRNYPEDCPLGPLLTGPPLLSPGTPMRLRILATLLCATAVLAQRRLAPPSHKPPLLPHSLPRSSRSCTTPTLSSRGNLSASSARFSTCRAEPRTPSAAREQLSPLPQLPPIRRNILRRPGGPARRARRQAGTRLRAGGWRLTCGASGKRSSAAMVVEARSERAPMQPPRATRQTTRAALEVAAAPEQQNQHDRQWQANQPSQGRVLDLAGTFFNSLGSFLDSSIQKWLAPRHTEVANRMPERV